MSSRVIYITKPDMQKLKALIAGVQAVNPKRNLEILENELNRELLVREGRIGSMLNLVDIHYMKQLQKIAVEESRMKIQSGGGLVEHGRIKHTGG